MRTVARTGRLVYDLPRAFHEDLRNGLGVVLEILWAVLAGTGIGLSLAAPPGPVNAIIASQTVTRSWRAGFLVGMGATTADTIFLAVSIVAHSVVASMQGWVPIIALLGAQRRIARTYQAVPVISIVCLAAFAVWLVWSAVAALL